MTFDYWWENHLVPNWKTIKIEVTEDMKTTAKAAWSSAVYECRNIAHFLKGCYDAEECASVFIKRTEEMME